MSLFKRSGRSACASMLATVCLSWSGIAAAQSNATVLVPLQGLLTDADGAPISRSVSLTFSLYGDRSTVTPLWSEVQAGIQVDNGSFTAYLGSQTDLTASLFRDHPRPFLGVKIDSGAEMPRVEIGSAPNAAFSAVAGEAVTLQGRTVSDILNMRSPGDVPIGTIIDWWRPNANFPVPAGYQVCDGSLISDVASPYYNANVPDLSQRFVRGVTDPTQIGVTGGSDTHVHTVTVPAHTHTVALDHTHGTVTSAIAGDHTHTVDLSHTHDPFDSGAAGAHNHSWASWSRPSWTTYDSRGGPLTFNNQPMAVAMVGARYPLEVQGAFPGSAFYTSGASAHAHLITVPAFAGATAAVSAGAHSHAVAIPPFSQTVSTSSFEPTASTTMGASNVPAYIGLLKIMRIK